MNYLSFGGRITLIKATLFKSTNLFPLPSQNSKGVAVEIERLQNQFLWEGQEASKPHLIKRGIVASGKKASRKKLVVWPWAGSSTETKHRWANV